MRKWTVKNGVIEAVTPKPKKVKQIEWIEPTNKELRDILNSYEARRKKVSKIFRNI